MIRITLAIVIALATLWLAVDAKAAELYGKASWIGGYYYHTDNFFEMLKKKECSSVLEDNVDFCEVVVNDLKQSWDNLHGRAYLFRPSGNEAKDKKTVENMHSLAISLLEQGQDFAKFASTLRVRTEAKIQYPLFP